jgi:ribosomal protein L11 methyltransferase
MPGATTFLVTRGASIHVPPRWEILPPDAPASAGAAALRLVAGPGFGDGRHPTTQLCLQAIAALAPRDRPWRLLDFGSGSGVLSIAGALLGATVDAVEIDPRAIEHAEQNLRANAVAERVRAITTLDAAVAPFDLVVANILRDVLVDFAPPLVALCGHRTTLVLSGLVSTDVPVVSACYAPLLARARPEVYERDEWRALVWRGRA